MIKFLVLSLLCAIAGVRAQTGDRYCQDVWCVTVLVPDSQNLIMLTSWSTKAGIGWFGLGTGDVMKGSEMVILSGNKTAPNISRRFAMGNVEPTPAPDQSLVTLLSVGEAPASAMPISYGVVKALVGYPFLSMVNESISIPVNDSLSNREDLISTYTFVRSQTTPNSRIDPSTPSKFVFSLSSTLPGSLSPNASLMYHDLGYGSFTLNLGNSISKLTSIEPSIAGDKVSSLYSTDDGSFSYRQKLILAHGGIMIFAWSIFSSIGILVARFLRHLDGKWLPAHATFQIITIILTVVGFSLGVAISSLANSVGHFKTSHQLFGLVITIVAVLQGVFGGVIHRLYKADITTRPWRNAIHIYIGLALFFGAPFIIWIQLNKYASEFVKTAFLIWSITMSLIFLVWGMWKYKIDRKCEQERNWSHDDNADEWSEIYLEKAAEVVKHDHSLHRSSEPDLALVRSSLQNSPEEDTPIFRDPFPRTESLQLRPRDSPRGSIRSTASPTHKRTRSEGFLPSDLDNDARRGSRTLVQGQPQEVAPELLIMPPVYAIARKPVDTRPDNYANMSAPGGRNPNADH